MSYDICFLRVRHRADPLVDARRLLHSDDVAPNKDDDNLRQMLVADILAIHSSLRMEPDHKLGLSNGCWIGAREGDCPFPDIEIGVRSASISISYANESDVLKSIEILCDIFSKHGYVAYDPQTDALWSHKIAQSQFGKTQSVAIHTITEMGEAIIGFPATKKRRPWWKFW